MAYERVLVALGNLTRCLIFERLRDGLASVGSIAADIPVTRPAVSQHLNVLKKAGLVTDWRMGKKHMYQIDERGLAELRSWLAGFPGDTSSAAKEEEKSHTQRRRTKRVRRIARRR